MHSLFELRPSAGSIFSSAPWHGKIASIVIDEEAKGPDDKGIWTVKGAYVTVEGDKEEFDATVSLFR